MDSRRYRIRQHYTVTVDTVQLSHHVLDGNSATTNYTILRIFPQAWTLKAYDDLKHINVTYKPDSSQITGCLADETQASDSSVHFKPT
eukprot:scaffold25537_cov78-Skeletonema_dohrnii-CCMP3373.AAC.1